MADNKIVQQNSELNFHLIALREVIHFVIYSK